MPCSANASSATSSAAFLARRSAAYPDLRDEFIQLAAAIIGLIHEHQTSRQVYGVVDRRFQAAVDRFEELDGSAAVPDYARDGRMFRMYSERIQRRVGYARDEAART